MSCLEALEELCDAVGVTTVMHPAIRRSVQAVERPFCVAVAGFLRGRGGGSFPLPLGEGGEATLVFSRRMSARGGSILRIDPVDPETLERIRGSLRDAARSAADGRGSGPARP